MADLSYRSITLLQRSATRQPGSERWEFEQGGVQILVVRDGDSRDYRALARVATSMVDARMRFGADTHANSTQAITGAFAAFVSRADAVKARPALRVSQEVRDAEVDALVAAARQAAGL